MFRLRLFFTICFGMISLVSGYGSELITNLGEFRGNTPDLIFLSKFDHSTTKFIIEKVRNFLINNDISDPLGNPHKKEMTILKEKIVIEENLFGGMDKSLAASNIKSGIIDLLSGVSGDLIRRKGLDKLRFRIEIKNLGQKIMSLSSNINPYMRDNGSLDIDANFRLSDMTVAAESVKVSLLYPLGDAPSNDYATFLEFTLDNPIMQTPESKELGFDLILNTFPQSDSYGFKFLHSSFSDLQKFIKDNGKDISFNGVWSVDPSPFPMLRWGNQVWLLCMDPEATRREMGEQLPIFIEENFGISNDLFGEVKINWVDLNKYNETYMNDFKLLLLEQIYKGVSESAGTYIKDNLEKFNLKRNFWIPTIREKIDDFPFYSRFSIENIISNDYENVMLTLKGDLCTSDEISALGTECASVDASYVPVRKIPDSDFLNGLIDIQQVLIDGDSDLLVSVSEDYLTRLIKKTHQAGLWNDIFNEHSITLNKRNPHNMFIVAEKEGTVSSLYMDIIYSDLSVIQKILMGKKSIRMPLRFDVELHVKKKDGIPYLVMTIKDVDSSSEFLFNGKKEYGLAGVDLERLKRKFYKEVKPILNEAVGIEIEIEIPELRDMSLEKVVFKSNGKGRLEAQLSIEDDSREWIPNFFFSSYRFPKVRRRER